MILAELQPFLDQWQRAWAGVPSTATAAQRRAHFERLAAAMRLPEPPAVRTEERWLPVPANGGIPVRLLLFTPLRTAAAPRPMLLYMHGGAWMQGSPETHWDIAARLADLADAVVASVDYALAPERPFPAALEDCRAALAWCCGPESKAYGCDAARVAVGGDSAGGNLAAALTLAARGTSCALCAQLLIYPAVDFRLDRPSHRENADGPIVSVATMPTVNAGYCPDARDRSNPLAAPLLADSHAGLPPAYIAVAEHDPLRDEGLAYAEAIGAAGVDVTLDRGEGMIHGYLRAIGSSARAAASLQRMGAWLAERFHAPR
jgi:acetyl esterase